MQTHDIQCGDIFLIKNDTLISKLIRWFTDSDYSHCGIMLDTIHLYHTEYNMGLKITHLLYPACKFEHYRVTGAYDPEKLKAFMLKNIGNRYDWGEIVKIIFRINKPENDNEYICSELIREAYRYAGLELVDPAIIICTPNDIANSTYLKKISS